MTGLTACSSGPQEGSGEAGESGIGVTLGMSVECGRSHSLGARSMATMGKSGEPSPGDAWRETELRASGGLEEGTAGSEGNQDSWWTVDFTLEASAALGFRPGVLSMLGTLGEINDGDHIRDSGRLLLPREPVT